MPRRAKSQAPKLSRVPQSRYASSNGVRLHYLIAGDGPPVFLLHGYAETSHMWRPLIAKLAGTHTVIAPDLRGAGQSSTPAAGYTKAEMAQDIHALARKLGYDHIRIVGHDIGLMVAYAYAAQYPKEVDRIALMDAFLPGVGNWRDVWLMRDLWHFHFSEKRRSRSYMVANGSTSSISGTISQPTPRIRCRSATAGSTRRPMPGAVACARASSTFARSRRTRRILPASPRSR